MEQRNKEKFSPPALGGSSLLVVFAVLSLTVFALLSLSTVRADRRLGERTAQAVSQYYAADAKAQEILARLRAGETPEGVTMEGDEYVYGCPVSENETLQVRVRAEGWRVLRWQVEYTGKWEPNQEIEVWSGEDG